ncbi:hypothetical protein BX616_008227, partial [Lobosporangium transversale]
MRGGGSGSGTPGGNLTGSAGSAGSGVPGRNRFQDELDEIEQHVHALSLESGRTINTYRNAGGSDVPTRSNSGNSMRSNMLRKPSQSSKPSSPDAGMSNGGASPPQQYQAMSNGRSSPGNVPAVADLRRMNSSARGLSRDNSVRSTGSGGGFRSLPVGVHASPLGYATSVSGRSDEGSYAEEPVYKSILPRSMAWIPTIEVDKDRDHQVLVPVAQAQLVLTPRRDPHCSPD